MISTVSHGVNHGMMRHKPAVSVRFGAEKLWGDATPQEVSQFVKELTDYLNNITNNSACNEWDEPYYAARDSFLRDPKAYRKLDNLLAFVKVASPKQLDAVKPEISKLKTNYMPDNMRNLVQGIFSVLYPQPPGGDMDDYL